MTRPLPPNQATADTTHEERATVRAWLNDPESKLERGLFTLTQGKDFWRDPSKTTAAEVPSRHWTVQRATDDRRTMWWPVAVDQDGRQIAGSARLIPTPKPPLEV